MVPKESIDKLNGFQQYYNHDIDSSAAILKTQKIREVNYKKRKRKVDRDREFKEQQAELNNLPL